MCRGLRRTLSKEQETAPAPWHPLLPATRQESAGILHSSCRTTTPVVRRSTFATLESIGYVSPEAFEAGMN